MYHANQQAISAELVKTEIVQEIKALSASGIPQAELLLFLSYLFEVSCHFKEEYNKRLH